MNNQTIVFKISENLKKDVLEFYQDRFYEKKPPYSVFQVRDYDCIITLYESGKIMFQGLGADIEASYWIEQERILNKRNINSELDKDKKKKEEKKEELNDTRFKHVSTIGSDEVGTGDYFGPIIVTASYVDKKDIFKLNELGVRDSKKLTDDKIMEIGPILEREFKHVTYLYTNKDYNDRKITNMNYIKAGLHNKVLCQLIENNNLTYSYIVIDQFVNPTKYYEHIKYATKQVKNITFTTKAEDKCYSVAVSSIISRYIFLKTMARMSKELGVDVPLGANEKADNLALKLAKEKGIDFLSNYVKLNFKNTDKIKEKLNIK